MSRTTLYGEAASNCSRVPGTITSYGGNLPLRVPLPGIGHNGHRGTAPGRGRRRDRSHRRTESGSAHMSEGPSGSWDSPYLENFARSAGRQDRAPAETTSKSTEAGDPDPA